MSFFSNLLVSLKKKADSSLSSVLSAITNKNDGHLKLSRESTRRLISFTIVGIIVLVFLYLILLDNDIGAVKKPEEDTLMLRPVETSVFDEQLTLSTNEKVDSVSYKNEFTENCDYLLDLVKQGAALTLIQKRKINECVQNGEIQLTPEEAALVGISINPDVPQEKKEEARSVFEGQLDPKQSDIGPFLLGDNLSKIAQSIEKKTGKQVTPEAVGISAKDLKPQEIVTLAQNPSDVNKETANKVAASSEKMSGGGGSFGIGNLFGGKNSDKKDAAARIIDLLDEAKALKNEIGELQKQAAYAQALAKDAAKKLASGLPLTKEEREAIDNYAKTQEELEKKKDRLAQIKQELEINKRDIQELLGLLDGDGRFLEENLDSLYLEFRSGKKTAGKKVSKKQGRVIDAQKTVDQASAPNDDNKALINELFGGRDLPGVLAGLSDNETISAEKLVLNMAQSNVIEIPSGKRFLGNLATDIIIASNEGSKVVQVKIGMHIHDPNTGRIIIPSGSILTGMTSGFSEETGNMEIRLDKAWVGKKKYNINLMVGSADGSTSLKGDIYDTRGKRLLAALITSFTSGVLQWFNQNIIMQYQQSPNFGLALIGSAAAGGADVANRIAQMYAQDLQNAPTIYFAPKGLPVIIYSQ